MSYLREADLGMSSAISASLEDVFGFVPNVFRAQGLLLRIQEAQVGLAKALILPERALTRLHKEFVMLTVAAAYRNMYSFSWHNYSLRAQGLPCSRLDQITVDLHQAGLSEAEAALLDFAIKLATRAPWLSEHDIGRLREHGFKDEAILEAILVTALCNLFCTMATGLGVSPDFDSPSIPVVTKSPLEVSSFVGDTSGPRLKSVDLGPEGFPPLLKQRFGYIPNIFRAQTLRPDLIQAEVDAFSKLLQSEDALSHLQKECIFLVGSAANLNTYCVAAHCEMLRIIGGLPMEVSDQIAVDHQQANLSKADKTLLDFVLKLTARPSEIGPDDIDLLRRDDFTEEQILEAVAVAAFNNFFNTLQMGLGTTPDTEPARKFSPQALNPPPHVDRLSGEATIDPDVDLVVRVQSGDLNAFEELISRHSRRVYRTLLAIVGNVADAEDAMQETFLKVFQNVGKFERRSKFTTWLTRIATNTAIQRLRERGRFESIDDDLDGDEDFRPRQIRAWEDDPETLCSRDEMRGLVEAELMKLPVKFRVVLVLRDIEQLSGEEAAAALGLGIPALKTRLLRGRMRLREALSSHFSAGTKGMTL